MQLQEAPFLSDLFSLGQLVACTVRKLELVQEKKGRGKPEKEGKQEKKGRRIELSLKLNYIYDGLSIEAVHEGQVILIHKVFFKCIYFLFPVSGMAALISAKSTLDKQAYSAA